MYIGSLQIIHPDPTGTDGIPGAGRAEGALQPWRRDFWDERWNRVSAKQTHDQQ